MKIAIYHELPKGGARKSVNEMAKFLKNNHTVDLFTLENSSIPNEKTYFTNIKLFKFKAKTWNGKNPKVRLYKDTVELWKLYELNKRIAKEIRDQKYDLLFVHASMRIEAPFILRFKNSKKIFYLHDPYFRQIYEPGLHPLAGLPPHKFIYEKTFRKMLKFLDQLNTRRVDNVLANSKFSKQLFEKTYTKLANVSYLGVNASFYKPMGNAKKYDILYIGSKSIIDGYDTFQELTGLLDKKIKVKALLSEDEWVDDIGIRKLYNQSIIVLCLARNEPFGLIPLEAASCGIPVIAVNEGGYKETVINGKTGFLIERDSNKIKDKIEKILKDKKLQANMGKLARLNAVKNWNEQDKYKDLEHTLEKLTKLNGKS